MGPDPRLLQQHFDYGEEEFRMMSQYTTMTNTREDNLRRAVLRGFPEEKEIKLMPGASVRVPVEQVGRNVSIGLYSYVNGNITIGDNVLIGPHCSIVGSNHAFDPQAGWFAGRTAEAPVVIGAGSWLASNVTVIAGVHLGKCNLVCAGAVVTKSTEDYSIMAGVPAKKVGHIDPQTGDYIWYSRQNKEARS